MTMDLRNGADDHSQRMLNAIDPGTKLPIHRHPDSSVTIVCIRGFRGTPL
jgi:quercetin dioxygenase-like cupin family protein